MLVDDEPRLTDFLGVELEEEGYVVQIVSNISEAWQALQAELLPFASNCVFFVFFLLSSLVEILTLSLIERPR